MGNLTFQVHSPNQTWKPIKAALKRAVVSSKPLWNAMLVSGRIMSPESKSRFQENEGGGWVLLMHTPMLELS